MMAAHTSTNASVLNAQSARAAAVARCVHARCDLPPGWVRPGCIEGLAQMMVSLAPQLAVADLAVVVEVGLALFVFDDLVDDTYLDEAELSLRAEQLSACAAGRDCPEVAFDPLAALIRGIAARLKDSPLGQTLWSQWSRVFSNVLHAMVQQRRLADAAIVAHLPALFVANPSSLAAAA